MNCLFVLFMGECSLQAATVSYLRSGSIVLRKFIPLCYKHVIATSPHRIKDYFSLVFSKFSQFAKTLKIQVRGEGGGGRGRGEGEVGGGKVNCQLKSRPFVSCDRSGC